MTAVLHDLFLTASDVCKRLPHWSMDARDFPYVRQNSFAPKQSGWCGHQELQECQPLGSEGNADTCKTDLHFVSVKNQVAYLQTVGQY